MIAIENVRLFNETKEALEQQTATGEILRVIASSPTDLQTVMNVVAESAARFCGAADAAIWRLEGESLRFVASYGRPSSVMPIGTTIAASPRGVLGRAVRDRKSIHVEDIRASETEFPETVERGRQIRSPARTMLGTPLLREGVPIGVIYMRRFEVQPFTDKQIELARTFADQAVIAIENVRLFKELETRNRELTESLEQQTATAEILGTVSQAQADVQPVFEVIADSAMRLFGAWSVAVYRYEAELLRLVAARGGLPGSSETLKEEFQAGRRPTGDVPRDRAVMSRVVQHVIDVETDPAWGLQYREHAKLRGFRSIVAMPMLRREDVVGVIAVTRKQVGGFTSAEIALLQTFADQAVIAIENARLLSELQAKNANLTEAHAQVTESLEQQTATAEILRVIASSPTDLEPVMQAVVENAARVCGAMDSSIFRLEGDHLRLMARHGPLRISYAIGESAPVSRDTVGGRVIHDRRTIHVKDILAAEAEFPATVSRGKAGGSTVRTMAATPLLREGRPLGVLYINRGPEPNPFSGKQIALLETFANQAVIAIENVRLFTELQEKNRALTEAHAQVTEALDQQTATAEILRVISGSPTDVQPVFKAMLDSAVRLCSATVAGVYRLDGERLEQVVAHNATPAARGVAEELFGRAPSRDTVAGLTVLESRVVHIEDAREAGPAGARRFAELLNFRGILGVPLLREGIPIGAIVVGHPEVGFTSKQIALLETFANQAVLAIENVRLFNETKEALEQQTATGEILRVIASSPTEVQPVFDTIVKNVVRLCDAVHSTVFRVDEGRIDLVAHHNIPPEGLEEMRRRYPAPLSVNTGSAQAARERAVVQISDVENDPTVTEARRRLARIVGYRSQAWVPMLKEDRTLGVISVSRHEAEPFPAQHITLLQTFADQAVIAIENVRLFNETKEALEQQTATAEILRVISSSPTDLQPVLDAVVQNAARVCGADDVVLARLDGSVLRPAAGVGPLPKLTPGEGYTATRESVAGRAVVDCRTVHIHDLEAEPEAEFPRAKARQRLIGFRTVLATPLLREGTPIGAFVVRRMQVRPFTEKQVKLLETFAAQAVIAIENVRLFTELQEKNRALTQAHTQVTEALEQQTATSEVLKVISRSTFDLQPVLGTLVENAAKLCAAEQAFIFRVDRDVLRLAVAHNASPELQDFVERNPIGPGRHTATARVALERRTVHIIDILADPEYTYEARRMHLYRAVLGVPMFRGSDLLGVITVNRSDARPFTQKQIELVETFADQAVIAIENVRLLQELQARTDELARSVEELRALGEVGRAVSSTLDLQTVLTTIVSRAVELSGTSGGVIYEHDEVTGAFGLRASHQVEAELVEVLRGAPFRLGEGVTGRAAALKAPVQVEDLLTEREFAVALVSPIAEGLGYRSVLAVPLLLEDRVMGGLTVWRKQPGGFAPDVVHLLQTFGAQSSLAIQNARLFREIADKSRQLEAASRHKSEFLANMSHELRTPLNAILGFSEVLAERMFGEVNEKQAEYLQDILSSGRHLLSLINDILDLSKVEAGRLELELARFHLPTALDNALTLVRERATRHGITLTQTVDPGVGDIVADERKVKQILLNLLSNAVKFTPEGGRVGLTATAAEGVITIAVSDTGIGIAPEDQAAIFEEFRQVGREDARKQEGTGLGLTLAKKFVELHGGRIWVQSQVGQGSTFTLHSARRPTAGVRAIREEAGLHGHDVSPVPGRQPRRRTILPRVRRHVSRCLRCLWRQGGGRQQVLRQLRVSSRGHSAATGRGGPPLWTARELHPQALGREDPHLEERPRGRAEAGDRALRRRQGLDGAPGRPGPRRGPEAPRPGPRTDDGGRPPL